MPGNRYDAYPLTATSRRRRRLALRHDYEADAERAGDLDDPPVESRPWHGDDLPHDCAPLVTATTCEQRIARVLAAVDPRTWLIVGESFRDPSGTPGDWPGWIDLFTSELRGPLGRRQDVVVDACVAGSTLAELGMRLKAPRFPMPVDVVLLICGPADAQAGIAGLRRFENRLAKLAHGFSGPDTAMVVGTSPIPWAACDELRVMADDVYAEAVRAFTLEQDLLLVDHRRMWDQAAATRCAAGSWCDGPPDRVSAAGHAALARLTLETLCSSRAGGTRVARFMPQPAATSD